MQYNLENNISSNWHEMKHRIKSKWGGSLSNRDINKIKGKRNKMIGTLINKFELTPQEAEQQLEEFWN